MIILNIINPNPSLIEGENNYRTLLIDVGTDFLAYTTTIKFISPNGTVYTSEPIQVGSTGTSLYQIPAAVLDAEGCLQAQIEVSDPNNSVIAKSKVFVFTVYRALEHNQLVDAEKVYTVGDLIKMSENEIMKIRNLGKKSYQEVINKIKELGLELRED